MAGNKTKQGWSHCALRWKTQDGKWLYVFHGLDGRWFGGAARLPPSLVVLEAKSLHICVVAVSEIRNFAS